MKYLKLNLLKFSFLLIAMLVIPTTVGLNVSAQEETEIKIQDSIVKTIEIRAKDYGAFPDDNKDDIRAIQKALKACKEQNASTLVFEKGQYDFFPLFAKERYCFISNNDEGLKRIAFDLTEFDNLKIDGKGSLFMFHGYISPFVVEKSSNITFDSFSIDYKRTFHSESIILGYDENGMDVEIKEGFPFEVFKGMLLFTDGAKQEGPLTTVSKSVTYGSNHILEYDTEKRETAFMVYDYYFKDTNGYPAELIEDRKVRLNIPGLKGTVGNTLVFGPNHRKHPGFVLSDSKDVVFENISIQHAGGMGILGQRTHNVTVDHCQVVPSGNRMVSSTADATHFVNCTGKITLTNNLFRNQKDDATNIHGIYVQIVEQNADDKLTIQLKHGQQHGFDFLKPDMQVELVRAKSMITYDTLTVKSVNRINKELTEVTFTEKVTEDLIIGDALAEIRDYPEILIAKNIITSNRARGMLLNCRGNTIVEDNTFHSPGAAILFEGDSFFWYEQGGVRNCIIRNNNFKNCLYGVWGTALIDVKAGIMEDKEISRYNKNVLIENNTFTIYDDMTLLNAYCVDGLTWKNNKVIKSNAYPKEGQKGRRFVVNYSDNIKIDDPLYLTEKFTNKVTGEADVPDYDKIININGPEFLQANEKAKVEVEYSVTEKRDIYIFLQDTKDKSLVVETVKTVKPGMGKFTLSIKIPNLKATEGYRWGAFITPETQGYESKVGDDYFAPVSKWEVSE